MIAVTILTGPLSPPERPYVSCIDGHIVERLSDCPQIPRHGGGGGGGAPIGGGGGGLLGGLLGGIL